MLSNITNTDYIYIFEVYDRHKEFKATQYGSDMFPKIYDDPACEVKCFFGSPYDKSWDYPTSNLIYNYDIHKIEFKANALGSYYEQFRFYCYPQVIGSTL